MPTDDTILADPNASTNAEPHDPVTQGSDDDEVTRLRREVATLRDQLARAQSDYVNYVRRSKEEIQQIGEWSENALLIKLLPILDNLERSLTHIPVEFKLSSWTEGLGATIKLISKILEDLGVTRMETIGKEVDYNLHDVVSSVPDATTLIKTEIEAGYLRGTKPIRHAKVVVGSGEVNTQQ